MVGIQGRAAARPFVLFAALLMPFVLSSGGRQEPQQPPLQHEVSVTLKLIQVYVTDKGGRPVRDLTKDEFRLTDNGKPVTLSAFEKHDLAAAPTAGVEAPAPEPAPVLVPTEIPVLNRKFILFFDFAFNTAVGIQASLAAARHFVDTEVHSGDELAFVTYSMLNGLRIREFLTTDYAKIKAALAAVSSKDVAGRADEIELAYWLAAANPGLDATPRLGLSQMEMNRLDSMRQAGNYFRALTRFAQALRLVQGQKSVLFFSNGVPSSLVNSRRVVGTSAMNGINNSQRSNGSTFEVGNSELRQLQEAMLKEFSASSCSIYAFDTRESSKLPALFTFDEMAFVNRPNGGMLAADSGGVFRDDKTTGMDSLKGLSKETGGKYYSNIILHEKNLDEVSAVTGTYYVLGYTIPAVADGEFHKIGVEVGRKGCTVRTQPGYYNPKPFDKFTDLEKDIHLFDLALNEKSEFQAPKPLPVSGLTYDAGQGARVRVLARIPASVWAALGGETAELVALFFDAQDSLVSLQRAAVAESDYDGKEILFSAGAAAGAGAVKCRIIVRDLDTGQSAVGSTTVYGGPANRQTLAVFTPLLLVGGERSFSIDGVVKGAADAPAWRDIYAYDPNVLSPVVGRQPVEPGKVAVLLPYAAPGLAAADLVFTANVVNAATGRSLDVPLELGASATRGSVEVRTLEAGLEGVPEGNYILFIHVGNKLTNQVTSARVPLTVGR